MPLVTSITGEIHPGYSPQSPVVDGTLKLILFSGVFVVGQGRYGQKWVDMDRNVIFIAFCYPKSENARKKLNNW